MRKRFQLCSKVVGMVSTCAGLFMVINSVANYITNRSAYQVLDQLASILKKQGIDYQEVVEMAHELRPFALIVDIVALGLIPIAFGFYFMASENIFVRLCYGKKEPSSEPE